MGGDNKMVKRLFFIVSMFCVLWGCNPIQVTEEEVIGIWVATDSAELILKEDRTFMMKGFNPQLWILMWRNRKDLHFKVDGEGKWKMGNEDGKSIILLDFQKVRNNPTQVDNPEYHSNENVTTELPFETMGTNSPFYNKPPWVIGIWESLDSDKFYEFQKKE